MHDGWRRPIPGFALGILTADCAPVLLAEHPRPELSCAAHAGWKGALAGIIESAVDAMEQARRAARTDRGSDRAVASRNGPMKSARSFVQP